MLLTLCVCGGVCGSVCACKIYLNWHRFYIVHYLLFTSEISVKQINRKRRRSLERERKLGKGGVGRGGEGRGEERSG